MQSPNLSGPRSLRAMLIGIVASGVVMATLAQAQVWTPPPGSAPGSNTPELIWNSDSPLFGSSQSASFDILGDGTLGGGVTATNGFAAGGYGLDPAHAVTTPSFWSDTIEGLTVLADDVTVGPGGITLGGETRTTWPSGTISSVNPGTNLSGGGASGDVTLSLTDSPSVTSLNASGDVNALGTVSANDVTVGPGGITLDGVTRTTWPSGAGGTITSVNPGTNLSGGGASGDVTLSLVNRPSVAALSASEGVTSRKFYTTLGEIDFTNATDGFLSRIRYDDSLGMFRVTREFMFDYGLRTGTATGAVFQGPVTMYDYLNSWSGIRASTFCTHGGSIGGVPTCQTSPFAPAGTMSASKICLGPAGSPDCIASWPAGGGGGGGTVTSVGSGTGLTGGPITGSGTLSLGSSYVDGSAHDSRFVNVTRDTMTGSVGAGSAVLRVTNTGTGIGIMADSSGSSGQAAVTGLNTGGGSGIAGVSDSGSGIGVWGRGDASGGLFMSRTEVVKTRLATATDGVNTTHRVVAPEFCIGGDCLTSWPVGGVGTVTQVNTGTGLTGGPITGTGTVSLDASHADGSAYDSRFVNVTGDSMTDALNVTSNSSSPTVYAVNNGSGIAIRGTSYGASSGGIYGFGRLYGGRFQNDSTYTYAAWGGYGILTNGSIYFGGKARSGWPTLIYQTISHTSPDAWRTFTCGEGNLISVVCNQAFTGSPSKACATSMVGTTGVSVYRDGTGAITGQIICMTNVYP